MDRYRLHYLLVANAWKIVPGTRKPPVANRGLPFFFKHRAVRASSSGWLLVVTHIPCLCDKAPDHAVATCHLEAHSRDWLSESARLAVRWYVRKARNLSAAMETDSVQRLSPEGIETPDGSLLLLVAKLKLDLHRWVHEGGQVSCGIGPISPPRIHSSQSAVILFGFAWC